MAARVRSYGVAGWTGWQWAKYSLSNSVSSTVNIHNLGLVADMPSVLSLTQPQELIKK
jgi:hypothetical protein